MHGISTAIWTLCQFQETHIQLLCMILTLAVLFVVPRRPRPGNYVRKFVGNVVLLTALLIVSIAMIHAGNMEIQTDECEEPETTESVPGYISYLKEDDWVRLTMQEKRDILQTVTDIETQKLGVPDQLVVVVGELDDGILACYCDATLTIEISREYLESSSAYEAIRSCCHEVYHGYQYRLIDAYQAADEELRRLKIFESAVQYEQEFENYDDGDSDYSAYYNQKCESDARAYAEEAVRNYCDRSDVHLPGG